jgi:hypothetical protein
LIAGGTNNHMHLLTLCPRAASGQGGAATEGQQFTMAKPAWIQVCLARATPPSA